MPVEMPKKVEEALFYRLKQKGFKECSTTADAYAQCCSGRVLSVVWACRKELRALSDCMSTHTSRLEDLKQRYLAAGSPSNPDWDKLLDGL
ncbi:hypothetical protein D9Q98_002779 [Chlorella vulgaris]|uniref:COX assembly mitochondrial protein n=1 Tax=Chlorella vulgaris TaxID=3077 RepID=A0A9D4TTW8_CHLVU|nr:hypothetical protein D9Q98_002779 [Chlorella vulgaris]